MQVFSVSKDFLGSCFYNNNLYISPRIKTMSYVNFPYRQIQLILFHNAVIYFQKQGFSDII